MGLLRCAKCGCAITGERKKGKYVYYHCTNYHGGCDNTYIREERLADLLGAVIAPIQITVEIAQDIAAALQTTEAENTRRRDDAARQLAHQRRALVAKLDRGYDDFVSGRISEDFWTRKSTQWETELQVVDAEQARSERPRRFMMATAEKILELAKQAENLYKSQNPVEQRRLLQTVLSNCTFDSGTLCPTYSKPFDLLVRGNQTCPS